MIPDDRLVILAQRVGNKFVKAAERLKRSLGEIDQRWQDRFVPEKRALGESYIYGDFDIVLHMRISSSSTGEYRERLIRIVPDNVVRDLRARVESNNPRGGHFGESNVRDEHIVFVDLVQLGENPQQKVPVSVRFYHVLEEGGTIGIGQGLLYRSETGRLGRYQFLPFFVKREGDKLGRFTGKQFTNDSRRGKIQSGSQIVYSIADDKGEDGCDFTSWFVNQLSQLKITVEAGNLNVNCSGTGRAVMPRDLIKLPIQGRKDYVTEFLDVFIGPLDL